MDLIYIYGPPGVGKYTVAKELSRLTGYRLFHNQLSIEFVRSVFEFGSEPFNRLVLGFRAEVIEEAARSGMSLIFTSAYAKGVNDSIIKDIMDRVESNGGRFCPVQLHCEEHELMRRVELPSRNDFYKIRKRGDLDALLKKYNHTSALQFVKSLYIDNTSVAPAAAAMAIMEHYGIPAAETLAQTSGQ